MDTFRWQHPGVVGYTYWGYRHGGRKNNRGISVYLLRSNFYWIEFEMGICSDCMCVVVTRIFLVIKKRIFESCSDITPISFASEQPSEHVAL